MAISKTILATILFALLVAHLANAVPVSKPNPNPIPTPTPVPPTNSPVGPYLDQAACGGACATRCSLSKRPRLCRRACGSCCRICRCVPSGTSGNYGQCPCYAKLTTRGDRPKCP